MSRLTKHDSRGFRRLSEPGDKLGACWEHEETGWTVFHCGHPTANFGYYASSPNDPDVLVVNGDGRGWPTLKSAFSAVREYLQASRYQTDHPTRPGARILATFPKGEDVVVVGTLHNP